MSSQTPHHGVEFVIEAESATQPLVERGEQEPFRLLLLGDFSGSAERKPLAQRRPIPVDRDNFEEVLAKLRPVAEVPAGRLTFLELDDFHPDAIYTRLAVFAALRDTRARLADPSSFREAASELLGPVEPAPRTPSAPKPADDLVGELLSEAAAAPKRARADDDLQAFIRQAVRPYLVARPDPRAPELIRQVDDAAADMMREIVHDPAFQTLEALWRTVLTVVRTLETGPDLKIQILDITKDEARRNAADLRELLVNRADPPAIIATAFTFGGEDVDLLHALGAMGSKAGAAVLGEADLSLLDAGAKWTGFRKTVEAKWTGLALPRILLRLPYGSSTIPCERFAFEEAGANPDPRRMLWGNPAPFCAMLVAQAFESQGWGLRPGSVRDITGLPVYTYKEDGESLAMPCAEVELTEDTAQALADNGFIPMASLRNRDTVRVLRFQSAADPASALPGRWQ